MKHIQLKRICRTAVEVYQHVVHRFQKQMFAMWWGAQTSCTQPGLTLIPFSCLWPEACSIKGFYSHQIMWRWLTYSRLGRSTSYFLQRIQWLVHHWDSCLTSYHNFSVATPSSIRIIKNKFQFTCLNAVGAPWARCKVEALEIIDIWSFIKSKHKNKQKQNAFYTVPIVLV